MSQMTAVAVIRKNSGLLAALIKRDLQNRYAGSVAGMAWALFHPLALLALYALVFEAIFRVKIPNLSIGQPYVVFIAVVLWPWMAFQEGVNRGTTAVQNHAALVKKVAFDHELLIYSAVLSSFAVHGIGYALVLSVLSILGYGIEWANITIVIALLVALLLMAIAVAMVLGALQVFIRDVEQVLSQATSVLFYATPILFTMTMVPDWLAVIMQFNPLTHITEPLRNAWLGLAQNNWQELGILLLGCVLAFTLARKFFLRLSPYFEDMV
jgi:lipopolysaccharide transport system permease protein